MDPSNADLLAAIRAVSGKLDEQGVILDSFDFRLSSLETQIKLLVAAYQAHGQHIGVLMRATPIPTGDCG